MENETVVNSINYMGIMTVLREAFIDERYIIGAEEHNISFCLEITKGGLEYGK